MSKDKPKGLNAPGVPITAKQREEIFQVYLLTGNKTETARRTGLSVKTVRNHLKQMSEQADPEFQKFRRRATEELAGKVYSKATEVLDNITPEDMTSGRIELKDDNDNVVRVIEYGPSLMQKVTAHAILVDKVKVLREVETAMDEGQQDGGLLLPQTLEALKSGIRGKLKGLTFLNVQLEQDHPDLSQRVQAKMEEAEAAVEAEYIDITDFDNPE
jgi:phage terminase small subunit